MSGYTPLFSSLTTGTLCGRWPDIGLWPIVLSLADKNGLVDVTTQYISSVTGLDHSQVVECMKRFCDVDPGSRSAERSGARLELIEPSRPWGWIVVNHGKYREKARLLSKNANEVSSGKNRVRMTERADTAAHRRSPPDSTPDRPSDSYADADSNKNQKETGRVAAPDDPKASRRRGTRIQTPFPVTDEMRVWAAGQYPNVDVKAATAEFEDYWIGVPGAKGLKLDWEATWRNRIRDVAKHTAARARPPDANHMTKFDRMMTQLNGGSRG